jgi:hypothetical protein
VVTVGENEVVPGINFGNRSTLKPGSIEGRKWVDENGNGRMDDDEPGLGGVTIYLDLNRNGQLDDLEPQTVTRGDDTAPSAAGVGRYGFTELEPGTYVVREVVPDGYVQTFPPALALEPLLVDPAMREGPDGFPPVPVPWPSGAHVVRVASGQNVDGINFGNQPLQPGSIAGLKWRDDNGNGRRDVNEPGLADVTIYLDLNHNGRLDEEDEPTTITVADDPDTPVVETGLYAFVDVDPGFYRVREVVPEGHQQTYPRGFDIEPAEALWADGNWPDRFSWGGSHFVRLRPGQTVDGVDFGNRPVEKPASVHGRKWIDRNGNGERENDEPGLHGVRIYLDADLNNRYDRGEPITVTQRDNPRTEFDEEGWYLFEDVEPGFYIVREIVPEGYEQTFPEEFACDAHFCVGRGHMVDIQAGRSIDGLHFGNQPVSDTATVEGVKWVDLNGNGQRERNEPPMADVVIYADLNGNRRLERMREPWTRTMRDDSSTPPNETGFYRLEGIPAGETVIREVVPARYRQTYPSPQTQILESISVDLPAGRALSLEWLSARSEIGADGQAVLALTFEVVWRDGCGTLLPERAEVSLEGERINVQLFGTHEGRFCTMALHPERQTVRLDAVPPGAYEVRTFLYESERPGEEFERSFGLEGQLQIGGGGGHRVRLRPGEVREGLHFGNQPLERPDPTILKAADFDHDGRLGAADINLLAAAIRSDDAPAEVYDLSGDGLVSDQDFRFMVQRAMRTTFGDSNLDGRFDSSDLVKIFQAGKYEAGPQQRAGWEDGDWNGDGYCNSADLVFVFQQGQYEADAALSAKLPAARAVDILLALSEPDERQKRPAWV